MSVGARSVVVSEDVTAGESAFFRYPAQLAPQVETALRSRDSADRYGLWIDDARGVGGIVRVELPDGTASLAFTCATCHAFVSGGALTVGLANARLDIGRLAADRAAANGVDYPAAIESWGPGRVDVTTRDGTEPARIPDLRPVRWLTHLHHDATVAQTSVDALAVRLETLLITSHSETVRPPRAIARALASYVWSLGEAGTGPPLGELERRGKEHFATECVRCHAAPHFTGPPVPLDVVGTDPTLGRSLDRGTGTYRTPSLRGVADRALLLHDGSVSSLDAMFDPARLLPAFTGGTRPGPVPGHPWGLDLDDGARRALVAYLGTL